MLKKIGLVLFKNRSYTPIPFVILLILFAHPTLKSILAGAVFVVLGELLRVWAVSYAGSETRTTGGVGGSNLVTQGPFGIVRNPLYIGNVAIYVGFGIMSKAIFPYLTMICFLYFLFQYYCIILNEEEYLQITYKEKFDMYKKYVNRLLPSFKKLPFELKSTLPLDINEGFKSDKNSLTAIFLVVLIILAFYFSKINILA